MDDEKLGLRFWGWLAGVLVLGAIGLLVLFLILGHAFYAWGFFGGFIAVAAILLGIAWVYDRRQAHLYEEAGG